MDSLVSELVSYDRRPEDLSKAISDTLSAIAQISGKSIKTMFYGLSLLKLPSNPWLESFDEMVGLINIETIQPLTQNQKFVQARDLLLPRLMSGAIEV
ncbi:MAG: hypothetical protein NT178_17580 [Proteobacteria bacterium]|nr:hypothetical protein [Pseudomonadota bacterium]